MAGVSPSPYQAVDTASLATAQPDQAAVTGTYTIPDPSTGSLNTITLSGSTTLTFPAVGAGKAFWLKVTQSGAGSFTLTYPSGTNGVKWPTATAPTLSTVAGKSDYLKFTCIDGVTWVGQNFGIDVR